MAEAKPKKGLISHGIAAQNRKARFDYAIKDTVEAGLVLKGPEVKSLRHGRATLSEAWAGERDGEMWLFNAYIPEYQGGVLSRFEPRAPRKLLLKRKQIRSLAGRGGARGRHRWCRCRSTSTTAASPRSCWDWARAARSTTSAPRSPIATGSATRRG